MLRQLLPFAILFLTPLCAMEMETDEFYAIYLPGINGKGSYDSFKKNSIINLDEQHFQQYTTIGLNGILERLKRDLGQGNCIRHFDNQLRKDIKAKGKKIMLAGSSQATGTIIDYMAGLTQEEQNKIKLMILETALAHGNSAIMSTIENILFKKSIFEILKYGTYLPAARAWLPWFGKFYFPTYNPCGIQPLSSVKKISTKIPIIIMHHINDPQLSINNARKLYCALRQAGNNNAYLFECTSNHCEIQKTHFNILNTDEPHEKNRKICAIQAIYKKHGLPFNAELLPSSLAVDLTPFQPNIEQVKEKINLSTKKGRYIRNTIDTVFCTYLVIHIMIRLHLLMLTKTYLK